MVAGTNLKTRNASTRTSYTSASLAQIYLLKWLVAFGIGLVHTLLVNLFYKHVPKPYMDEIFHVNQTQAYCNQNWNYWNEKLTTPPLIYVVAALTGFCDQERYFNSAIVPLTFISLTRLRLAWTNGHNNFKDAILCSIAILLLPVLFETNLLFYTDLLSLTLVIFALGTPTPTFSALIFMLSVLSRQTNIIWAAFYCICHLQRDFDRRRPFASTLLCVLSHWAFALLGIGFVVFFVRNNFSIVLGDRTAHQLHLHLPQLFYFATFTLITSLPIALYNCRQVCKHIVRHVVVYVLIGLLMIPAVHYFSYTHLYLLSDNRHFTFYIWKRWFLRAPVFKFLIIPLYLVSFAFITVTTRHLHPLTLFGGFVSTCLVLIPAHLVEFRYFLLPYAVWRLNVQRSSVLVTILEIVLHLLVNFATITLFLYRPFEWSNEPGKLQRFMW